MRPLLLLRAVAWLKRIARSNERLAIAQEKIAQIETLRWAKESKAGRKPQRAVIDVMDDVAVEKNYQRELTEITGLPEEDR